MAPHTEAGLAYTGRTVRVDARHSPLSSARLALSLGIGASGLFASPGSEGPGQRRVEASGNIPGLDARHLAGWGLDAPVLVGWRSTGALVQAWLGARAGFERAFGDLKVQSGSSLPESIPFEGHRWYTGSLVGMAIGVEPVWAALEFQATYNHANGSIESSQAAEPAPPREVEVDGWSISPAAALWFRF